MFGNLGRVLGFGGFESTSDDSEILGILSNIKKGGFVNENGSLSRSSETINFQSLVDIENNKSNHIIK